MIFVDVEIAINEIAISYINCNFIYSNFDIYKNHSFTAPGTVSVIPQQVRNSPHFECRVCCAVKSDNVYSGDTCGTDVCCTCLPITKVHKAHNKLSDYY